MNERKKERETACACGIFFMKCVKIQRMNGIVMRHQSARGQTQHVNPSERNFDASRFRIYAKFMSSMHPMSVCICSVKW